MISQQCSTYEPSQDPPPWMHVIYGYGGPHSRKQELLLAPQERAGLSANLLYLLSEDLGRLESSGAFALAFANLSRRAPGRRCLAIYVASRVAQSIDEVGRSHSTFKHAAVACERPLNPQTLAQAAQALVHSTITTDIPRKAVSSAHEAYRRYLQAQQSGSSQAAAACDALIPYVQGLDLGNFPAHEASELTLTVNPPAGRCCYITYPRSQDVMSLIEPAARLAITLHQAGQRSKQGGAIAWTSVEIGAGHPLDVQDGVTLRFVAEEELPTDNTEPVLPLAQLPPWRDDEGYGRDLFELLSRSQRRDPLPRVRDLPTAPPIEPRGDRDTMWQKPGDGGDRTSTVLAGGADNQTQLAGNHITKQMTPVPLGVEVSKDLKELGASLPKIFNSQPVPPASPSFSHYLRLASYVVGGMWAVVVLAASVDILWTSLFPRPVPVAPIAANTIPKPECACPPTSAAEERPRPSSAPVLAQVAAAKSYLPSSSSPARPERANVDKSTRTPERNSHPEKIKPSAASADAESTKSGDRASPLGKTATAETATNGAAAPTGREAPTRPLHNGGVKDPSQIKVHL